MFCYARNNLCGKYRNVVRTATSMKAFGSVRRKLGQSVPSYHSRKTYSNTAMSHQFGKTNAIFFLALVIISFVRFTTADVSATVHFFLQDGYYFSSSAPAELSFFDEQQCRRKCAISETCQSYVTFTNTLPLLATCYLYDNKVCITDNNLLKLLPTTVTSRIYSKVIGNRVASSCNLSNESGTAINEASTMTFVMTQPSTTLSAITTISFSDTTVSDTSTTAFNVTATSSSTNSSSGSVEPRPRSCLEYFTNGTIDDSWTLRPIWLSGTSDGVQIGVYCKTGYTLILSNFALISPTYSNKNDVTVFGSVTKRLSANNAAAWSSYTLSVNFPALSNLVATSGRMLYYESTGDLQNEAAIYSGLDIASDGTLTITGVFQILTGFPSQAFTLPVTGSPFVNTACGSFWFIPVQSSNPCGQGTSNLLYPGEYQKVGGSKRRLVALAFK